MTAPSPPRHKKDMSKDGEAAKNQDSIATQASSAPDNESYGGQAKNSQSTSSIRSKGKVRKDTKIATFNLGGSVDKLFLLLEKDLDVILLQEHKLLEHQIPGIMKKNS